MGEVEIEGLQECVRNMEEAARSGDRKQYLRWNRTFHFAIYSAASSDVLCAIIENLWLQISPYFHLLHALGQLFQSERTTRNDARRYARARCSSGEPGRATRTRSLPALTAGAADAIIAAKARAASLYCTVFWHHFHGAATRMAPDGAAFGLRREHLMVEIVAGWKPDGDDGAAHRRWAQDLWQSLAPFALPGGYANLLGPDDREQAAAAYGGNAARLRDLKRRFDPDGVFASAIPLPEG
jgi:hypothetical protein